MNGQQIGYVDSTDFSPIVLNSITRTLNQGDTLDLLIGSKENSYYDSTPVDFIVTPQAQTLTPQTVPTGSVTISGSANNVLSNSTTATVYDATKDFSSSNPNGVWQYGWESTLGSSFNYSNYGIAKDWGWANESGFITNSLILKNTSQNTTYTVQPGQLEVHPGSKNEYAALRFVTPSTGKYDIFVKGFAGDLGETDATVLLNGQNIAYAVSTNSSPVLMDSVVRTLNQGDTLDLLIGSKGNYYGDTTPVEFVVTPVAAPQTAPTGSVTISGTAQQNQTLTASNNLTDANNIVGSINYQWLSGGNAVSNQASYALTQNDVGKSVSVTASYTDGLGKLESVASSAVTISNVNDFPTGSVSILGEAKVGQTLTAQNTLQDLDGLGSISYQWLNNGAVLSSQSSYTLTASDAGKTISLKASYTDLQNTPESVTSSSVIVAAATNYAPTGNVTISGTAQQNQTLTASNNLADANNIVGSINYQWLSGGNAVSNQASYALTQNDVGKSVSVTASYTDGLGKLESVASSAVTISNVNDFPTGSVSILGEAKVGQTLTAQNTLQDLDGLGSISYQWLNNGAVLSSQSSYTLTNSDANKSISLKASYSDLQGTAESVTSSSVTVAAATNYAPTGSVTISGTAQQNQTLTASNTLADANGLGTIGYQWLSNGVEISGKTQSTYTLTQNDVGKNISVKASYTDGLNKLESMTSSSVTISNVNDFPTGSVSISGEAKVGQTLTAQNTLQDLDGLGSISYQWLNNGAVLSSQSSYTLTASDVGKTISLKASYTDLQNTSESVTSSSVIVAAATNYAPTGNVTISGTIVPANQCRWQFKAILVQNIS